MHVQGLGGLSIGWLHNRAKSAIDGWDVFRGGCFQSMDNANE